MGAVLRINVRNEDLTMSRFAVSPLWELIQALRLLPGGSRQPGEPVLRPWLLRARDRYRTLARETDLGVIRALNPPSWGADFLTPVPAGVNTTIGDLLEPGPVDTRGPGAARGRRGAGPAASGRSAHRAHPG